jgi:hypothetical protein
MAHGEEIDSGQPGGRGNAIITSDHKSVNRSLAVEMLFIFIIPQILGANFLDQGAVLL